jgi:hypothetical protein
VQWDNNQKAIKFQYFIDVQKVILKHQILLTQFAIEESVKQRRELFKTDPNFIRPYFTLIDKTENWVKDTKKAVMVEVYSHLAISFKVISNTKDLLDSNQRWIDRMREAMLAVQTQYHFQKEPKELDFK